MQRLSLRFARALRLQTCPRCTRSISTARAQRASLTVDTPSLKPQLREYQEECVQSVLSYLARGERRLGISLATGSGKTVIFTQLISRIPPPKATPSATQTLVLVHRRELAEQAYQHCRDAYPDKTIEIEMGKSHASGVADITIASIQSISSGDRIHKFDPRRFKLVLVDEAHHIVAPKYLQTLSHFGLRQRSQDGGFTPALIGVSATFSRFDGLKLGAAIDHIVYHRDYVDMIGDKWLSDVLFTTVESKADLRQVKLANTGDFAVGSLSRAVNTAQSNEITVRSWMAKAANRKSTIGFCVDLSHVYDLTNTFRKHGIDAHYITGTTPKQQRAELLDSFKAGEFPVLLNCGVFTEGTDIPNIDCVLLARPTRSRNLLVQMIGRGMRLFPGKKNCHVIDMVSSLSQGVISTPTLFGLDPSEILDEDNIDSLQTRKSRPPQLSSVSSRTSSPMSDEFLNLTMTDYDSVHDLIADTSGERHIRTISQLAWVHVGVEKFILTCGQAGFLTIERLDPDLFVVRETLKIHVPGSKSPYMRPREVASADTFQGIVHAADTYAHESFPRKLINLKESWRTMPATDGQVDFLNKFRNDEEKLTSAMVTKGKAGDMITKIRHGARGLFARVEIAKRREEKKQTKELEMKQREEVKVGALEA
jgi:ATP-dependent helicase IRC3